MTQEEYTAFVAEYGENTIPSYLYTYGDATWADLLTNYSGTNITYDELGNPLNWVGGRGITLTWENGRQLKQYKRGAARQYDYTYNADGLRTGKTITQSGSVTKQTEYYIVNGQYIGEVSNIGGTDYVIAYVYDENGAPAGINVNGSAYYFAKNLQGDIVAIMAHDGTIIARYFYDAWGDLISVTDGDGNTISSSTDIAKLNPFRYRGYMYDDESGFYYLRSRYYDPNVGRFLNADGFVSTGQGFDGNNMFAYCNDNPVMFVDYFGNCANESCKNLLFCSISRDELKKAIINSYACSSCGDMHCAKYSLMLIYWNQVKMPIDGGNFKNDYPDYESGGFHGARDILAPIGTPVYAAFSGVVIASDPHWSYGENVVIKSIINGKEYITIYAHLAEGSSIAWDVGQTVFAGEQIGCVGMTGNTSDPHLHFEMREYPFRWGSGGPDDYDGDHINPFSFFGG